MTKNQNPKQHLIKKILYLGYLDLEFCICLGFRYSDLGFHELF